MVVGISPVSVLSRVDLPQPDGPSRRKPFALLQHQRERPGRRLVLVGVFLCLCPARWRRPSPQAWAPRRARSTGQAGQDAGLVERFCYPVTEQPAQLGAPLRQRSTNIAIQQARRQRAIVEAYPGVDEGEDRRPGRPPPSAPAGDSRAICGAAKTASAPAPWTRPVTKQEAVPPALPSRICTAAAEQPRRIAPLQGLRMMAAAMMETMNQKPITTSIVTAPKIAWVISQTCNPR